MLALHEQLRNPLTRLTNQEDMVRIAVSFPELAVEDTTHCLSLRRYLDRCPDRFMNREAFETYLGWLQERDSRARRSLQEYLTAHEAELNQALLFLREVNGYDWHDQRLNPKDDLDLVRFIDQQVHPTYLRVSEAVLAPLLKPLAHFSRLDRKKKPEGLDVFSVVEELKRGARGSLCSSYVNVVRNGIGHGGITYGQREIEYKDKKGNREVFQTSAITRLFDDLLDTCNGMSAALRVWFIAGHDAGYRSPREVLFDELLEETRTPWWTVEGCIETTLGNTKQLVVYVRPDTRHVDKVNWSTIQTGILAEYFAPGYDRYLLSLRTPKALPGWATFDGQVMARQREREANTFEDYQGVLVDDLIFYAPHIKLPKFLGRIDTLWKSFRINMPVAFRQIRANLGIPKLVCRGARVHRNGWRVVVNAEVVLEGPADSDVQAMVRRHRRRIVRTALRTGRKGTSNLALRMLPLGYAHVAVFRKDYRSRRLEGFGLGEDLVCTVRLHRIRRIKSPDIMGSTVETKRRWRLAWNRAWLEATGQAEGTVGASG